MRRVATTLIASLVIVACRASSSPANDAPQDASTDGAGDARDVDAGPPEIPTNHRATATPCSYTDAGPVAGPLPDDVCATNADCTAKPHGNCIQTYFDGPQCFYDACTTDADCGSGSVCACSAGGHEYANTCAPSECVIDSDCGPNGYCSPSINCDFLVAYYCHRTDDECENDTDCHPPNSEVCWFDGSKGHWACFDGMCEGD